MLTVNTFKKFCLKSGTKKADEVHDYYIKMEELVQETLNEETNELRLQLENKEKEKIKLEEENKILIRKYVKPQREIIEGKNVVYIMTSEEAEKKGEYVVGKSVDLNNRKDNYDNNKLHDFKIIYYKSCNSIKLMDIMESIILMKLGKYRSKIGRDVFLLPELENIKIFINIFDECFKFFENVKDIVYPKRTIKEEKESASERHAKYKKEHIEKIKENNKEYYKNNKEILSEYKKEYYNKNSDKIAIKNKKYYEENKNKVIEQNTKYYEVNKEELLEKCKEYYKDNKEQILEERAEYYKDNYKTKIAPQRQKKETCECGMVITHYYMKKHKKSSRHKKQIEKINQLKDI